MGLLLALVLLPESWSASIQGRVTLTEARAVTVPNKRYEVVAKGGVLALSPPLAVVYLEGKFDPAREPALARVVQKDLLFSPALLPIRVGTRVEFPNLDDTYHNIFSYSAAKRFDLGRYRPDERPIPSQVFDLPGLVTLRCDIHEHMRALILVLDTPHFVVTDETGRFRLEGLPVGSYVLKAWLNSRVVREQPVVLKDDGVLEVNFP
ncbi:MAG: carboxypeptidase regulatory-like domain-containing protein [Opitutaceae bacterium]